MRPRRLAVALCALAIVLARPSRASAAPSCAFATVSTLDFGTYTSLAPLPADSEARFSIRCTGLTGGVMVSLGRGYGGNYTNRQLRGRSMSMQYNLFLDAARTIIWGDGSEGTSVYTSSVPDGQQVFLVVYGRVFPRQGVDRGTYSDVISLTINY